MDFEECDALDLFAGTGSITLELLSRGCRNVTSVELDREHFAFISSVMRKLDDGAGCCAPTRCATYRVAANVTT